MLHLFTPVGISIFLNFIRWAKAMQHPKITHLESAWQACLNNKATENEKKLLIQTTKKEFLNPQKFTTKKNKQTSNTRINKQLFQTNQKASAEIQSIHQILQQPKWQGIKFKLHLLATDSQTSPLAGGIIKSYFQDHPRIEAITVKTIEQLQINQSDQFRDNGIQLLINYIHSAKDKKIKIQNKHQRLEGLLNITSGYKGITPILTIVGQLLNIPLVYLYERSDNLIEIPPLPLSFNWNQLELFQYCFAKLVVDNTAKRLSEKNQPSSAKWIENEGLRAFFYREMLQNALVREVTPANTYEITFLGKLLRHHIHQVFSTSTRTFGIAFEFLFYESFINEPFTWEGYSFDWVIHNRIIKKKKLEKEFEIEFDLELRLSRTETTPFVIGEICSYGQLADFNRNRKYSFLPQLKKQIKFFSSQKNKPWGYLLIVYSYEGMSEWKQLEATIQDIKEKLAQIGINRFRVLGVMLPILSKSSSSKNPYSTLYQKKITRKKQQWRQGSSDKYGNPWLWLEEIPLQNSNTKNQ